MNGPIHKISIHLIHMEQLLAYLRLEVQLAQRFASTALVSTICLLREPGTLGQRRSANAYQESRQQWLCNWWTSICGVQGPGKLGHACGHHSRTRNGRISSNEHPFSSIVGTRESRIWGTTQLGKSIGEQRSRLNPGRWSRRLQFLSS